VNRVIFQALFAALLGFAGDERWFIDNDAVGTVSKQTAAEILVAACEGGKVDGDSCSKCPNSDDGPWAISSVITGHFSSAGSEEVIVSSDSCYPQYPGIGIQVLLGKRNGKWIKLEDSMSSRDACTRRKMPSGREFLICESWGYHRDGEVSHSLSTAMVEDDKLAGRELFRASDTTAQCWEGTAENAEIKDVVFHGLDISITATAGFFQMNGRRLEQCRAAFADAVQTTGKGVKQYPQPPAVKTYKIQYLFDGKGYTLTPASRAAAALFDPAVDHSPPIPPPTTVSINTQSGRALGAPASKADAATFQDFCGAQIVNGGCTKKLFSWETVGNWTIREYRVGHFVSPASEDAILTALTPGRSEIATKLWTRKDGKWEMVTGALLAHEDIRDCITVHLKTGLDRLVCMDTSRSAGYRAGLFITGTIRVLVGSGTELMFRDLIHAANNLTNCSSERPEDDPIENSIFDKMEGGDAGRSDGPDLIITARYGEREATRETELQCKAALAKKPGAKYPAPRLSTFRLEYNFDGLPLKESEGVVPTPATKEKATNYFSHLVGR
jgi:hypothetical protein